MSKAENFILEYTRNCSNEILSPYPQINNDVRRIDGEPAKEYHPWLTPLQARRAVEIAREETVREVCEWLDSHLIDYWSQSVTDGSEFIEDLKKNFEDKV